MIDSGYSEAETMQRQAHHLPTIDEIIDKVERGIIDDSMATILLVELERLEPRGEPKPDAPARS